MCKGEGERGERLLNGIGRSVSGLRAIYRLALVGFQGRGFVDGIQPDFGHSLLLEALIFQ